LRPRRIALELSVLAKNDRLASENRKWLSEHGVKTLNIISSPGAGKTRLLERTVERLNLNDAQPARLAILTGDQEEDYDAERLRTAGAEVRQINTHSACHLDAAMIGKELSTFVRPGQHRLLIIENVGNLVCPAAFDLGESHKVALLSTTEGEDKPSKYPLLFRRASLIVLTKIDLIPHLDFSLELCTQHLRRVNPTAPILMLSAKTGEGMDAWIDFLMPQAQRERSPLPA
jgi:hydrogenase nickel incorporation protein HypB